MNDENYYAIKTCIQMMIGTPKKVQCQWLYYIKYFVIYLPTWRLEPKRKLSLDLKKMCVIILLATLGNVTIFVLCRHSVATYQQRGSIRILEHARTLELLYRLKQLSCYKVLTFYWRRKLVFVNQRRTTNSSTSDYFPCTTDTLSVRF